LNVFGNDLARPLEDFVNLDRLFWVCRSSRSPRLGLHFRLEKAQTMTRASAGTPGEMPGRRSPTAHGDEGGEGACRRDRAPRRKVSFDGFGVLEDRTTFALSVVELSYDGCRIKTDIGLFPGLKFKVSLLGFGGAVDAEVRWHKDGHAGVIFCREDEQHREWIARAHDRFAVSAQLSLRRLGRKAYEGALLDLTPRGCKVEFVERPKEGEIMWAKFDALDAIEATVRWVDGFHGGLEFVRPIHPAIFDSLLARLSVTCPHQKA
jgi:hypothetical protein